MRGRRAFAEAQDQPRCAPLLTSKTRMPQHLHTELNLLCATADNFAIPLAACLSDLITLTILAGVAVVLRHLMRTLFSTAVFLLLLGAIALNTLIVFRNAYVQELLTVGFGPLLAAMAISSGTGVVLESFVNAYDGFALLATTVTAISGGTGSILVSRLSTSLHSGRREHHAMLAVVLWALAAAAIALCLAVMAAVGAVEGRVALAVGVVTLGGQMPLALLVSYQLTMLLWRWDYDPDSESTFAVTSASWPAWSSEGGRSSPRAWSAGWRAQRLTTQDQRTPR